MSSSSVRVCQKISRATSNRARPVNPAARSITR
jgi:hypothetical protein